MNSLTTEKLKSLRATEGTNFTAVNTLPMHLFFSVNIPAANADFVEQVEKLVGSKTRPVVVYCASRKCNSSERAARKLQDAGFRHVYHYVGGAQAWKEAGERIVVVDR